MAIQTFVADTILTAAQMNALQGNDYNQTVSTKTASYTLVAADKGTKIVMNSASATTITVNTSLFSAGDTLTILNIAAGVCTVTAGTATVSTTSSLALAQNGGGTLYFTSAGVSVFQADGVTAGMTVISSGSLTGASVAVTGIAGYKNLQLQLANFYPATAGQSVLIRLNNNSTASTYQKLWFRSNDGGIINNSDASWPLDNAVTGSSATSSNTSLNLNIYNVADTSSHKVADMNFYYTSTTPANILIFGACRFISTTAVTQVNILTSSGNFGGGTYILYGIN